MPPGALLPMLLLEGSTDAVPSADADPAATGKNPSPRDWIETGAYDRIVHGDYPRHDGTPADWREDLGDGFGYYAHNATGAAGNAGDAARKMKDAFDRGFRGKDEG